MKHFYLFWLLQLLLPAMVLNAQVVTTSPPIVQRSSSPIVVTFHADQGNKGLSGMTSRAAVYAHTGVIVSGSSEWKYASEWLDNSEKYKMTYVSSNTWQLTIPSIDEFYGTTADVDVVKLAFVFRNSTGSREGKTADGGDIFVDVYPDSELEMSFTSDAKSAVLQGLTSVNFTVNTSENADISLYVNSVESTPFASAQNVNTLTRAYELGLQGNTDIIAKAVAGGVMRLDTLSFCSPGNAVAKDYPGGVPKMGAVNNPDGTVTFCLAAPSKVSAFVVGSWNNYKITDEQYMHYQDYEGYRYFWITVNGLKPSTDYIYYYYVDGARSVGDPYAKLVLDPYNDQYISPEVFPNFPTYPSDYVKNVPLAIYNSSADEYEWKISKFKGVDQSHLIIYELLIRDFTGTEGQSEGNGTIAGVMEKLDYLKSLGVNAIELMPIMEFNGNNSWGYNTNFYFAPDKAYGTPADYRKLIDAIHERGMAVILDIVFNQSDGLHPWYQLYDISSNPFYNGTAPHSYSVLNDWNQDNALVQRQFKEVLKYWLEAYKVDGFRFDLVKGLGANDSYDATYNASSNTWSGVTDEKTNAYNASRVARMKELHDAMREVNPDAYFINEDLAGAEEENDMAKDGETNWANINYASAQIAMGYQSGSDLNRFYAPDDQRTWGTTVSYAESHDEERLAYKIAQSGVADVKGNTVMSMRRLGSIGAVMLMAPGAHMIWQFQEFGADQTTKNSSGNDTSPKKVVWSYLDEPNHAGLKDCYAELCSIRAKYYDMFDKGVTTSISCNSINWNSGYVLSLTKGTDQILLAVNPAVTGVKSVKLPIKGESSQYELLSSSFGLNDPTIASDGTVSLNPGAYCVFGTKGMSNLGDVAGDVLRVYGELGRIVVDGDYKDIDIFRMDGVRVSSMDGLASGMYIVVVDGNLYKVMVK
ncbi:MAG: alpha-amylase family glycosyl hydrolase [Muribaculum sp.]|nr:alpha-amylase family glycosyl hydrolase [Muribaculum sp.]